MINFKNLISKVSKVSKSQSLMRIIKVNFANFVNLVMSKFGEILIQKNKRVTGYGLPVLGGSRADESTVRVCVKSRIGITKSCVETENGAKKDQAMHIKKEQAMQGPSRDQAVRGWSEKDQVVRGGDRSSEGMVWLGKDLTNFQRISNLSLTKGMTESRLDSVSILSRQSDLDQVRAVSVGLSARVWKHVAMIFAVLVMSVANIGMAWGDTAVPTAAGTYSFGSTNIGGSNKFGEIQTNSVFIYRNSSYATGNSGIKCVSGNNSGFVFYITSPMTLKATIYQNSSTSETVTLNVKTVSSSFFQSLVDGTPNSTTVSAPSLTAHGTASQAGPSSKTTFDVSYGATLAAGYYYVYCTANSSTNEYQRSITLESVSSYYYRGEDNSWGSTAMTASAGGTYEYIATTRNNHQFKITTCNEAVGTWSCANKYNYSYVDGGFYGTSITTIGDYSKDNCYIWSAPASYYIIVFKPSTAINTTSSPKICASATLPQDQFTISFAAGSGTGSMSAISSINAGADQAVTANSFTAPSGYQFAGWKANVDVKVGGATKTAGTVLADGVTIQDILSDITLTAQWELIPTYDVIYNTNGGTGGSTASQTGNLSGAQVTTSANGFTKTGYKFKWWNTAANGSGEDFYPGEKVTIASADVNLYAQWEEVASGWAYWVGDVAANNATTDVTGNGTTMRLTRSSTSSGNVDWNTGLTASSTVVSQYSSTDKHAKVLAVATDDQYLQVHFTDGSPINSLKLGVAAKDDGDYAMIVVYSTTADFSSGTGEKVVHNTPRHSQTSKSVTDFSPSTTNKYFYARIYRNLTSAIYDLTGGSAHTIRIYSVKAEKGVSCSTPAAPTNFTAGSISATGATFTITDAADAASYDIYYSTESTAPTSGTAATTTSTSKTKAVTGLTAATTYYAWVRSVCDASHKSAWVALNPGGDTHTFATSCVAPSTVTVAPTNANGYRYTPGETISLTCTASGGSGGDYSYQWQKYNGSAWEDIDGATSAVYSKANCTTSDGGSYRCKVSTGEDCTTISDGGDGYKIRVWTFNGNYSGEDWIANNITWTGANTGTVTLTLNANSTYNFKVYDNDGKHFGCNSGMTKDESNWTFYTHHNNASVSTGKVAGEYTFTIDITNVGDNNIRVSVVYPKMRIYMVCGGTWCDADPAFFVHSWKSSTTNDTKMIAHPCEDGVYYADLPSFVTDMTILRLKTGTESVVWEGNANFMNRSSNITIGSNDKFTFSSWDTEPEPDMGLFSGSTYSPTTYTVSAAASTAGYGTVSAASVTGVACGTSISASTNTLSVGATNVTATPAAATAEYTYAFDNWTWTPAGATVTSDVTATANFTRTPKSYTLTWNLDGGTTTSAGTGIGSGVSSNTTTSQAFGTALTAPTVTKTGYNFSAWSPSVASTMPAANTTYTATWAVKTTTITINANTANHGSTTPGSVTATWGSALPSFTAAAGVSGYSLTGYFTTATSGIKVINADGTLVASTDYADGSGNWKYETATLTLYAQYEEEAPTPSGDCGEIIKSTFSGTKNTSSTPSTTTFNTTGEIGGTSTSAIIGDNGKLNTEGAYLILKLSTGTFLAGDTIKISSDKSGGVKFATGTVSTQTYTLIGTASTATSGGQPYYFVLAANADSIIVPRGSSSSDYNQNPKIAYVSVCRPCPECAATPAAPTAFSAGSITSTGATFSITDAGDAASYDIYYATSSTAPTASTPATTTSTSKTKAVTGLTASTTYYAWVRSVCDASHKSSWVALSGSSFTTTSTPAELTAIEANVLYQAADMANITFTGSDQWFAGLSTNAKFKVYGNGTSTSAFGKNENHSVTDDIDTKNFTSALYITAADNTSTTSDPTKGAIEFITPSTAGTLYLYLNTSSSGLSIKKKGTSTSTSLSGDAYKKITVEANTHYFINGASSNRGLYGIKFIADVTAPTFVSSVPANGATGVATSGTIVLTFSEALGSVDASKFTLTGATKGAVAIDGSDATKVNIAYSGAEEETTVTLATAAAAVSDLAGNALAAALSDISFTTAAAAPAGDCDELFAGRATSTSVFTPSVGSATFNLSSGNSFSAGGYSYSVKPNSSNAIVASPKAGGSFAAGDSLIVVIYNNESGSKTMGFRLGSGTYSTSVGSKKLHIFRQVLVASDISAGKVTFNRQSSDDRWVEIIIKHCGLLPSCTTPILPTLTAKTVCEGGDADAAWNAAITNSGSLVSGETVAYSWVKKGGSTPVSSVATYQPTSVTEAMAGTYVVTATVSADGKASKSASKEVTLTVTPATETPSITASKAKVYATDEVTLTATCGSTGVTWNWYLCANADGTGAGSSLGTSATYTIASAPAAGTYYYKAVATGDGTNSCGAAEYVYTLVVSTADACDKEFWFAKEGDRPTGAASATHITGCPSGSSSASYTASVDGTNYTLTGSTGQKTGNVTIVVPADNTGTLYVVVQGSSSRTITLSKGGTQIGQETPENSTWGVFTFDNLDAGTYTLVSSGNISWAMMALKLCPTVACTDDTPTATATNAVVCSGTELSITASEYEESPTSIQWQKLNSSTSTWDNISGATSATYTVASATSANAGSYRVVVTKGCARTSNTVTIAVPSAPVFGDVPASVSVMQTLALSISTVEATDAVKYRWYKSADDTWDAGDVEIGTDKTLIKAYASEAVGSPSYYVFCRAQNACGITTSDPIAVNVTTYIEEDCATRGSEGEAEFGFDYGSAGQGSYSSAACWTMNSNSKFLTYTAPEGKYFKTAKVTIASSSESKASYNWSTNGGSTYTAVALTVNSTLTERTIDLSAKGNVNSLQIGRNFNSTGSSGGTLYVSKICFEYTESCTATTVTVSGTGSETYTIGSGAFTEPTITLGPAAVSGETLTYTSSNEDIATVDDDGTITFQGDAGTVTITAAYAGGEVSSTQYCASEGSYTITVSCSGGAPKVVVDGSVNMSGCNSSVILHAKQQDGTSDFADGTYQWFRNGTEIDGAMSSSYTATQAGTYTVERTNAGGCTTLSTNSATVTSETTEPEVERLVPFQYYHVDKTYTDFMKMRHLFAVKNSGKLDGKSFKLYVSRNGSDPTDVTNSNALAIWTNADGRVDTVMIDLNKLNGKYSENDELVFTCKAINCSGNVSDVYKANITMHVIGATPTLALICSGSDKASGTRKTGELTVGGDFLTGYNVADLCQQTGNTSFDANTEWGLYTDLKTQYIVTPVNGYAVFNKLNYEPFDILLLTDYPKASKSDAAKDVLDDMAALCDYRPMLSFKTHMVAKSPSKWAEKGFTTSPVVTKADGRLNLNIVCYAHPMFEHLKEGANVYRDADNSSELVYTMLSGTGYESSKGMQGFEIDAAENFVTIGLTHYNASATPNSPSTGNLKWAPGSEDRMLVTVAERQTNIEARFILFSLNCGAQSKLTDKGEEVILACLEYLLDDNPLHVADCSFTFDNGANAPHDADWYKDPVNCPGCSGELGDGLWSTEANWGPDRINIPGEFTSARIAAPVTVDMEHAQAMELRIVEGGHITIPAGKGLDIKSTIRRMDGSEISPTENSDIYIASNASGNGTLIFNNDKGDTKAIVTMYTTAKADIANMSAATSTWQYIGTPHNDVQIATYNYYDSWLYQYDTSKESWVVIPNGGPLVPFRGYCVTHPQTNHTFEMYGKLVATTNVDLDIPAGKYVVVANSWVAPIDINAITADDMEGITDQTIYFFNTGSDTEGTGGTGTAAGTYRATPINAASYTGDWQIPSMQGFYVVGGSSNGTLHLDYNRHVRPTGDRTIVSNQMYAPRRAGMSDEPEVAKLYFRGSRYYDRLVVLEREDFTRGYDSGWDGEAWGGNDAAPMAYVTGEGRYDAVSAIPEYEGTVVGFRAGEDSEYKIDFEYSEENEPLYLLDTDNNTYTRVLTGNAYQFTTSDKAYHDRFIFTRNAPSVITGIEPTSDSSQKGSAQKLLINEKVYILRNGVLYDATGKVVK